MRNRAAEPSMAPRPSRTRKLPLAPSLRRATVLESFLVLESESVLPESSPRRPHSSRRPTKPGCRGRVLSRPHPPSRAPVGSGCTLVSRSYGPQPWRRVRSPGHLQRRDGSGTLAQPTALLVARSSGVTAFWLRWVARGAFCGAIERVSPPLALVQRELSRSPPSSSRSRGEPRKGFFRLGSLASSPCVPLRVPYRRGNARR